MLEDPLARRRRIQRDAQFVESGARLLERKRFGIARAVGAHFGLTPANISQETSIGPAGSRSVATR